MRCRDSEADGERRAHLLEGWVIANHILVSFHVAFISSVLAIPAEATTRGEVLRFIFASPETLVSALFTYLVFHSAVALHELGHFLEAARLRALSESIQERVEECLRQPLARRLPYLAKVFVQAPYGRATGIKREGLNYYPDAPYNLAVAAAGPRASRNAAALALPLAALALAVGLLAGAPAALYLGRLLLGLGVVTLLDFLLADPGKYREFRRREQGAREAARSLESTSWIEVATGVKRRLVEQRMQAALHPRLGAVTAPWQFRNCGMGGRHTEKEYPESNISMQEAMFLILGAVDSQEAQEMTIRLQNRLKEILEKAEGCRVMGIGLEGGLAPYVDRGEYPLPEVRLWAMMKQAIEECGYRPGLDVAIALDPAMSELEIAYRQEFDVPDSVGRYLFWRDRSKKVLDRDGVLAIYEQALRDYEIPILSIEDGFSEDDHEGWRRLLETLGDRILVTGDDLVTTNDRTIESAAERGLINAVLVKANQIGSLYETLLAVLVTLGKGLEVVVSHRSKSPNDDMEAHIALATNALGLKAGGGANTERLVKYQAVHTHMERVSEVGADEPEVPERAIVRRIRAREEPTNAGIPTVGTEVELEVAAGARGVPIGLVFRGATPLGTSAGTGEAVHLVDRFVERAEHRETVGRHAQMFEEVEPGVVAFRRETDRSRVEAIGDEALTALFERSRRYEGQGCQNAVDAVCQLIAPHFEGRNAAELSLVDVDRALLQLELTTARRRGKLGTDATPEDEVRVMQRKQNLGMNGILSVSLALARGIARLRGRDLYELLREELLALVERLSADHGVSIHGSRFDDYVVALREVNALLESRGEPLYLALRDVAEVYHRHREETAAPAQPMRGAAIPRQEKEMQGPFTEQEGAEIAALNRALFAAHGPGGTEEAHRIALRRYLVTMTYVGRRLRMFEIANHRLFRAGEELIVPFDAHGTLVVYAVRADGDELLLLRRFPHGMILTDALIEELTGKSLELIDLEREIYHLDVEHMPEVRITRIRDMAHVLERLNACGSRHEAVYLLRFLVSRLCIASSQGFPGAKNIQPEVVRLRHELAELLNGPFASRLRLPMRILVRNVSGLVSRPKLIDELWQSTIDLAEVHVRGSAITNELRRSAHHALGGRTLDLARAYQTWLATGEADFPGHERPAPADEDARAQAVPIELVGRIVIVLEQILGSSQIAERVAEWREGYAEELQRCESGNSIEQDLEALIERGICAENRWIYHRYLRSLIRKCEDGAWSVQAREPFAALLEELQRSSPSSEGFEPERVEHELRAGVTAFVDRLRADHQDELFSALRDAVDAYERGEHLVAFEKSCELRAELEAWLAQGAFHEQRYFLHVLDCLLEEMGYLALRHIASSYDEAGVRLKECLRLVQRCAANLLNDGLFSRELWDLSLMLVDSRLGQRELLDVLEQIQRTYHRMVHRVSAPYQELAQRLGHDAGELRAMLGNFQRTLHDLNSLVLLADRARTHVHEHGYALPLNAVDAPAHEPWSFVHLSHQAELGPLVESRSGPSLLGLYGGKGAGLLYMSYLGVPTRDGFILPATLARMGLHETERSRLEREVERHVLVLEEDLEQAHGVPVRLGQAANPLLLAVRGGSALSMPGMLSTVVFVGMSDSVAEALAREDPWFAWDAYRRFLVSYAEAAWRLDLEQLDLVEEAKHREGVRFKTELSGNAIKQIVQSSKDWIRQQGHGEELDLLLDDPRRQLHAAIRVVHASWTSARARRYREVKLLGNEWQTAVIVQQMAAGNRANERVQPGMDETRISLTGVVPFTRVQTSGFREFTGDIKFSATGDDLVGGMTAVASFLPVQELRALAPMLERKLKHIDARLRRFRGTDPEIEFTVERGVLSVLQARSAQVETHDDPSCFCEPGPPAARGIGIRGGAFRGLVAFTQAEVESLAETCEGRDDLDGVLLVLENPTPDEIPLILSADGLLTVRGGSTSHAAVSVQGIEDKAFCAVMGVASLRVEPDRREATLVDADDRAAHVVHPGDVLSIHGKSGEVFVGSRRVELAGGVSGEGRLSAPTSNQAGQPERASAALRSSPGSLS